MGVPTAIESIWKRRERCLGGSQLPKERQDQRILLGVAQVGQMRGTDHPPFRIEQPMAVSKKICTAADGIAGRWTGRQPWG